MSTIRSHCTILKVAGRNPKHLSFALFSRTSLFAASIIVLLPACEGLDSKMQDKSLNSSGEMSGSTKADPTSTASKTGDQNAKGNTGDTQTDLPDLNYLTALQNDPSFSSFVEWVQAAGLQDQLSKTKNQTLFAPNNEAFGALSEAQKNKLQTDKNFARRVLQNHLVSARLDQERLIGLNVIRPISGAPLLVGVSPRGGAVVGAAGELKRSDIAIASGLMHQVQKLLLPPEHSLAEVIAKEASLSSFAKALSASDLQDRFSKAGELTVLAPNDEAFVALSKKIGEAKLMEVLADRNAISSLLRKHCHPKLAVQNSLVINAELESLHATSKLQIRTQIPGGQKTINGVKIVLQKQILAANGVVHIIDAVLP